MISTDMRQYSFYTYGEPNEYGQSVLAAEPQGKIKMSIYIAAQSAIDSLLFENSTYIGLTTDAEVNSTYVIEYGKERLKVLYVVPYGRYKQVYMAVMPQ